MLQAPDLSILVPQHCGDLDYFPNDSLGLVKLDLTFDAGAIRQQHLSQAHAASQLVGEATRSMDAQAVAEFLDFRGIVLERSADTYSSCLSFYFLRRYADELLPLIRQMVEEPVISEQLFAAYKSRRMQQVQQNMQKTAYVARNRFYEVLYGPDHPLGRHATPEDIERLTLEQVRQFVADHYRLDEATVLLAGQTDDALLSSLKSRRFRPTFPASATVGGVRPSRPVDIIPMPGVQTSLRMGCVLPFTWEHPDYAPFMVLSTVLGGYFGSRLMRNLREDKGYTYGIYAQTQPYRGSIVFAITADVGNEVATASLTETLNEIRRLLDEPVPGEELERVRNFMMGDFIRSIDGTFELSERYRQMQVLGIDERFSANYVEAVQSVTPAQLLEVARRYLPTLNVVAAGFPAMPIR